ncbi:transmembrane protein 182 isoform X2 [Paroedura picta]|uniref:transmembrane protein 182 isoform X2 n=1 Tax=Paroedura picta TaxID=143630 RepID=UPI004056C012
MKLSVAIFFGGLFGALGILLFLVAFGTDYWLLATEAGRCTDGLNDTREEITYHHEGFFWRCWFAGSIDENTNSIWKFWYIYRGFWSVLLLLGVVTAIFASFFIICAAPFGSHVLYKVGGGFFISAGILFTMVVVMYVIWLQAMADLDNYVTTRKTDCPDFAIYIRYGWSFILAPVGIFFAMFSGMLFLLVGRTIHLHSN